MTNIDGDIYLRRIAYDGSNSRQRSTADLYYKMYSHLPNAEVGQIFEDTAPKGLEHLIWFFGGGDLDQRARYLAAKRIKLERELQ